MLELNIYVHCILTMLIFEIPMKVRQSIKIFLAANVTVSVSITEKKNIVNYIGQIYFAELFNVQIKFFSRNSQLV